jgi:uncharacterized protein
VSTRLRIRLVPRAGRDGVDGVVEGELRCRVAAPAAGNAANVALLRLLARELDVAPSTLRIVTGLTSRRKVVELPAEAGAVADRRWPGLGG